MLAEKSKKVIGVDLNEKVIKQIRIRYKNIKNVEFVNANLLELKYESCFDTIVSFETIEHLEESNIRQLFHVFSRALKPGGKFIFSTPYLQEKSPEAIAMGFHLTFYIDETKINKWLSDNGLVPDLFKYQNYQTHDIVDELNEKDFIICVARRA
jgi:2-polyprenyl-3-methyl-5-hydroxy-6-metoxy-1,4-benzoquinol methylase